MNIKRDRMPTFGLGIIEVTAPWEKELIDFSVEHPEEYKAMIADKESGNGNGS